MPFVVGKALLSGFGVIVVCVHHLADTALSKCYYMGFQQQQNRERRIVKRRDLPNNAGYALQPTCPQNHYLDEPPSSP
jgi:hypothetical protein